jgi:uncharacterized protein YndB with AHSA1/START domain
MDRVSADRHESASASARGSDESKGTGDMMATYRITAAMFMSALVVGAFMGCGSGGAPGGADERSKPMTSTMFTTPTDRALVAERLVGAPREQVWEAWTSPGHLRKWMLGPPGWTMSVCEVDLRPGGASRLVWHNAEGAELEIRGMYHEILPPERLVGTESWGGEWPETRNTMELTQENGGTRMTVTIQYPSEEARNAAVQTGMKDGMSQSLDRLDEYLTGMR